MELELCFYPFLYGILYELHYSYMELELLWKNASGELEELLHYSYMELEPFWILPNPAPTPYYIIPIWNWSCLQSFLNLDLMHHYIIPIWNWSSAICITHKHIISNYIIPIWNWSSSVASI